MTFLELMLYNINVSYTQRRYVNNVLLRKLLSNKQIYFCFKKVLNTYTFVTMNHVLLKKTILFVHPAKMCFMENII